jgi:hypothetical protein
VLSLPLCAPAHASTISVGSFTPVSPPATFLVPVEITGAVDLQTWQFDLLFDHTVVEAVSISGAEFTVGNPDTTSFILGGFIFNDLGLVDDVAGAYPSLLTGPSGDGVLALIEFRFLDGQEGADPGFQVDDALTSEAVPVPASALLLLSGVAIVAAVRRLPRA